MGKERQSERERERVLAKLFCCVRSQKSEGTNPLGPRSGHRCDRALSPVLMSSLTILTPQSGLAGRLKVLLSFWGLFDDAGDSRDKQRIMMTEERWIDQHNSLFTISRVLTLPLKPQ